MPRVLQSPSKSNNSPSIISASQTSSNSQYFTPLVSINGNEKSSDSDSTLTDHSETDVTIHENFANLSIKHVPSHISKPEIDIQVIPDADTTKFFPDNLSKDSMNSLNKPIRKRDKIRAAFKKKTRRLHSNNSDSDINEWDEVLVKTLVSMQQDAQDIIAGLNELDQPTTDNPRSNRSTSIITKPRLSFVERQREKLELMRIAQMLHPPNLLTFNIKESPYPYTDIIEPHNFNFLRLIKQLPDENLFIQHKPFRHKKLRYRTQRGILRMRRDFKRLKQTLHGRTAFKSYQELPSFVVQDYRNRLQKTFLEVRRQINEFERMQTLTNNIPRKSIREIIEKLSPTDSRINAQMENYRAKIRHIEYIDKKNRNELNSAPYIPPRTRCRSDNPKKDDENDRSIDIRFDPNTFVDLNEEVNEFFGPDLPFWDQPPEATLSALSPFSVSQLVEIILLPSKLGVRNRLANSFKKKQKKLKNAQSMSIKENNDDLSKQSDGNNDEFFDCVSITSEQRDSEALLLSTNGQTSNSSYEHDTIKF